MKFEHLPECVTAMRIDESAASLPVVLGIQVTNDSDAVHVGRQ